MIVLKSKTTAIILSFLLGGFGAHHFYLGNKKRGLFFLALFWSFIPFFVAFVEFVLLLVQSEDDFNLQYNPMEVLEKYRRPHKRALKGAKSNHTTAEQKLEEELVKVL